MEKNSKIYNDKLFKMLSLADNIQKAEKLVLIMLRMSQSALQDGRNSLHEYLDKPWMSAFLKKPIELLSDGYSEEEIQEIQENEIIDSGYTGQELLERLIVLEGFSFILEGKRPKEIIFELSRFFGEDYHSTLVKHLKEFIKKVRPKKNPEDIYLEEVHLSLADDTPSVKEVSSSLEEHERHDLELMYVEMITSDRIEEMLLEQKLSSPEQAASTEPLEDFDISDLVCLDDIVLISKGFVQHIIRTLNAGELQDLALAIRGRDLMVQEFIFSNMERDHAFFLLKQAKALEMVKQKEITEAENRLYEKMILLIKNFYKE